MGPLQQISCVPTAAIPGFPTGIAATAKSPLQTVRSADPDRFSYAHAPRPICPRSAGGIEQFSCLVEQGVLHVGLLQEGKSWPELTLMHDRMFRVTRGVQ